MGETAAVIAPASDEVVNGWHRGETWEDPNIDAGDNGAGINFSVQYWTEADDGTFLVIEETFSVEHAETTNQPVVRPTHVVVGRTEFIRCTDKDDPGGTELWSASEYDEDADVYFHDRIEDAEASARRLALMDHRYDFTWSHP